jgi:hypothetical protein
VNPGRQPASRGEPLTLTLFVAEDAPASLDAIRNLHTALARFPDGAFHVEIVEIFGQPARALRARVLLTPTLLADASGRRVVGDLSDHGMLDYFLTSLTPVRDAMPPHP